MIEETKFIVGKYLKPVTLTYDGPYIYVSFKYNKKLIVEIKNMEDAHWCGFDDPPKKIWRIANSDRNRFVMAYLKGENPFEPYDKDLIPFTPNRTLYDHQCLMVRQGISRNYTILACEMGTGKSLAAIEIMEWVRDHHGLEDCQAWYVGPKSGVFAVGRELVKWKSQVKPEMYTYEGLIKVMRQWQDDTPAPKIVIFDESSKIKTPTSQRSLAAAHLATAIRNEWGCEGYVIEMSGTPAPKTPVDWWWQCEVAQPGYLAEGTIGKFKNRLCLVEERESLAGGVYPHIVTWLDDENKCAHCGELIDHPNHQPNPDMFGGSNDKLHKFEKSVNEVKYLYKRMKGLVLVQFKKDCLDLPEKQYKVIRVRPPVEILRAAKIIKAKSTRAITALNLLRELSDGFQYTEKKVGTEPCPNCKGSGTDIVNVPLSDVDVTAPNRDTDKSDFRSEEARCDFCGGAGVVAKYERGTDVVTSPKDEVFIDLLDEHEDVGRFIVWGGFHATVDRLVDLAHQQGWATLKVDGRGYIATDALSAICNKDDFLDAMDLSNPRYKELLETHPKLCFVGHPDAGGMALTLTASPTELFYSNSFKGESRMQAEDRFHRAGMDANRGATIIDLICLPSDMLVLENLRKKKKLQSLSMDELEKAFAEAETEIR